MSDRPSTLGELRASGWVSRSVKDEVREHAIGRIRSGEALFPGVLGYEQTVLPQLENALLAGHDVIFLGERGQAKSRMIRSITALLDEWMPIVAGSEINDDPYHPISRHARDLVADQGEEQAARCAAGSLRGGALQPEIAAERQYRHPRHHREGDDEHRDDGLQTQAAIKH